MPHPKDIVMKWKAQPTAWNTSQEVTAQRDTGRFTKTQPIAIGLGSPEQPHGLRTTQIGLEDTEKPTVNIWVGFSLLLLY